MVSWFGGWSCISSLERFTRKMDSWVVELGQGAAPRPLFAKLGFMLCCSFTKSVTTNSKLPEKVLTLLFC